MSQILILQGEKQELSGNWWKKRGVCFSQHQAEGRWILRGKPWKHLQFSTWVYWDKQLWVSWGHNSLDFTEKFKNWKKAGLKDTFSFLLLPSSAWPEVGLEGTEGGDLVMSRCSLRSRLGGRGREGQAGRHLPKVTGRSNPERLSRMGADCPSALLPQPRSGNFKLCPKNNYHLVILKESPFFHHKSWLTLNFSFKHTHTFS